MNKTLQVKTKFEMTDEVVLNKNFHKAKLTVMHDGLNNNGSIVPFSAMEEASESLKNTPILAFIIRDEDGNATGELGGHEVEIRLESKDDGLYLREHYLEQPIGVIPESSNIQFEEIDGKTYLTCDAYIWKSYSNEAYEILVDSGMTNASCEMQCKKLEFDEDDVMHITSFEFLGVTCIGVAPGMEGANINMNFSETQKQEYSDAVKELNTYLKMQLEKGKEDVKLEENEVKVEDTKVVEVKDEQDSKEVFSNDGEVQKENEEKEIEDTKVEFGLSIDNLRQSINTQLSERKVTRQDYWGDTYESREFWLETILVDDKVVILEDYDNWNKHYGVSYSMNGDEVVIDFDSKKEYIQEWIEKQSTEDVVVFEREDKLKDIVLEKFANKEKEIEELNKQLTGLQEFKLNYEKQVALDELTSKVDEVIAKFSFEEEEISELKSKVISGDMDVETFEDKLFAIEGRKAFAKRNNFSKDEEKTTKIEVKQVEIKEEEVKDDRVLAIKELKNKYL